MKKLLPALFILLLTISSCFALNIQINAVDDSAKPGGSINYELVLTNEASAEKNLHFYLLSDKLKQYSFIPSYIISVPGNSKRTVNLTAVVPSGLTPGRYYESLYIEIDDVVQTSQTISYTVEGPDLHFNFNSVEVPATVDPRDEFNVTLNFENEYSERVQKVYTSINIYKEDGTSLYYSLEVIDAEEGNNSVKIPVKLDDSLKPTTANARVNISWYDMSFGSKVEQFSIIGYTENKTEAVKSTSVVSSTRGYVIENNGTLVIEDFDYEVELDRLDTYFISDASVNYTLMKDSIIFHVPELYPGESVELYYEKDYTILYLIPFLIIGLVYLIHYFTRSVEVSKEVYEFKSAHNALEFKVVLNVKNVSKKKFQRIRVKDYIPPIITKVFDYGTLEGELKEENGREFIEWTLGTLKPGENVILSYRMRSDIGYLGELKLDSGVVEVVDPSGEVQSREETNTIIIDIQSKKEEVKEEK